MASNQSRDRVRQRTNDNEDASSMGLRWVRGVGVDERDEGVVNLLAWGAAWAVDVRAWRTCLGYPPARNR